jgi:hypothetical protein
MIRTFFRGVVRGVEGTNNGWSEMADRQARKGANRRRLDNRPAKRIRLNASNTAVNDIQAQCNTTAVEMRGVRVSKKNTADQS